MSAELYRELSRYSGKQSDKDEALDIYKRIVNRFPQSRYRPKAQKNIRSLSAGISKGDASSRKKQGSAQSTRTSTDAPGKAYYRAEACYGDLRSNTKKMKSRQNWLRCIDSFHDVYQLDPDGPWAAAGLYMKGKLYRELFNWSKSAEDLATTRDIFEQIIEEFPKSRYKQKAASVIGSLPEQKEIAETEKRTEYAMRDKPAAARPDPHGRVTISGLRFWSNPNYTRVVIDADKKTSFNHHLLKKDPSINKPQRLYVDLSNSRLGKDIPKVIPIDDDLLIDARAGQYTHNDVRVVVDIKSFKTYKIFSLRDPFRIVIDVWGSGITTASPKPVPIPVPEKGKKLPSGALAKQLALGVSRIVIDPGHGGKDYGAPGYLKGVHEKYVTLQISKRLAKKIREEIGCEVILTRTRDKYLTLEERTAFANTKNADLFISIHTNAHRDRRAYGIETFFLNLATDEEAIRVAALENATSTKNISDLQTILSDLMQNAKINESSRLAAYTQSSIISHLKRKKWSYVKDKGVKQAPFYVLLGATMPSILVETAFISNPRECKRLVNPKYQDRISEAIVLGIKRYIKEIAPTAYLKTRS
jgi:N-acetylmuramoyl-L-alanine amidase